jgi:hypothetical protein
MTAPSATPDRETFYDNNHNLPTTPSDTAVMSPPAEPSQFDPYSLQDDAMQYVHMGPPGYIKPEDVEPSQQLGYLEPESSQSGFRIGRHQSDHYVEDNTTHQVMQFAQGQTSFPFRNRQLASPALDAIVVKQRSELGAHNSYPPLPGNVVDDNDTDGSAPSDGSERGPTSKRKTNEDSEFNPGKRRRTSSTSTRKSKPKPACTRSRSGEGSLKAKPKASSEEGTHTSDPASVDPFSSNIKSVYPCPYGDQVQFQDSSSLENHIKKQHTRPFICVFHFAGCNSTFATKNEWKRHVSTQHIALYYWRCTEGACGGPNDPSPTSTSSSSSKFKNSTSSDPYLRSHGVVFNRKDLYTQHLRRMHAKPAIKKALKAHAAAMQSSTKKSSSSSRPTELELIVSNWQEYLRKSQAAAQTERVNLPTYMRCPASDCGMEFHGKATWDDRMEHVARHLESGDKKVVFGGEGDETLMAWLSEEGTGIVQRDGAGWKLGDPLKRGKDSSGGKKQGKKQGKRMVRGYEYADGDGELDAEGEDDDE